MTVDDLEKAGLKIITFCQRKRLPDEFFNCSRVRFRVTDTFYKLGLQIEDGVLCVGGHLSRPAIPMEAKHPIILAKDLHISDLLLRHVHLEVGHCGHNHMLSRLRKKYWITGASAAIMRVLSPCHLSKTEFSSNIPASGRLTCRKSYSRWPTTRFVVDYFGPFEVKRRRNVVKQYGVIFTCLAYIYLLSTLKWHLLWILTPS